MPSIDTAAISLQASNGKIVELSAARLEKWLHSTNIEIKKKLHLSFDAKKTKKENAIELLEYFGLQTPQDILFFWHSPEGITLRTLLEKKIAEEIILEEEAAIESQAEHELRITRLCYLLLGLLHRRKAEAEQLNEAIQQAIEKRLHNEAEQIQKQKNNTQYTEDLKKRYEAYNDAMLALDKELVDRVFESEHINQSLELIEQKMVDNEQQYFALDQVINKIYQELDSHDNNEEDFNVIQLVKDKIKALTDTLYQSIATLESHAADGREEEANALLTQNDIFNVQIRIMQHKLGVLNGSKMLYTATGQTTNRFSEAMFILSAGTKLVQDKQGNFHLLNQHQELDELSIEERAEAAQRYHTQRPQILGTKYLVQYNYHLEHRALSESKNLLIARSEILRYEISLVSQQLIQMQAERANVEATLKKIMPMHAKMAPLPAPSISNKESKRDLTSGYRQLLRFIANNILKHDSLDFLRGIAVGCPRNIQDVIQTLRPGQRLPTEVLQFLLRHPNLERAFTVQNYRNAALMHPQTTPRVPTAGLPHMDPDFDMEASPHKPSFF